VKNCFKLVPVHIRETLKDLRVPLVILVVLFVLSGLLYFKDLFPGGWDTDIFGNLATELAGVLLTFFLLGLYISHRERRLTDHRRRIALRSLSLALRRIVGTLFSLFKAKSTEAQNDPQRQVEPKVFFDARFYDTIVNLDFSAKAPVIPEMSWGKYLALNFEDFTNRLERALDIFGVGLFPGDLDLLELLVNSPYARMFTMNSSIPLTGASAMMLLSIEDGGSVTFVSTKSKEYVDRSMRVYHEALMKLIDIVNESLRDTDQESIMVVQHWEQHVAPAVGSARGKIIQPT
jgi:hypothetical protein